MIRVVAMEAHMEWLLFMLTGIIYGFTFLMLQLVAERFRMYITHPDVRILLGFKVLPGDDTNPEHTGSTFETVPSVIHGLPIPPSPINSGMLFNFDSNTRGNYKELHETLDVSVFK